MNTLKRLQQHAEAHGNSRVAVIGAGYVGTGVIQMLTTTPAVDVSLVIVRDASKGVSAYESAGVDKADIVISNDAAKLNRAIEQGKPAVSENINVIAELNVELAIEVTGAIDYGATAILDALNSGKHVISYNAEADALLGRTFHLAASRNDVLYTIADGDQPGVMLRLQQEIEAMGFEATALINCKRHLNVYQNPESGTGFTARDTTSAKMTTSFGDGTKMQVENAVVANVTGKLPIKRGMMGFKTTLEDVVEDMSPVLQGGSYVDFTCGGDFGAGVAALGVHSQHPKHKKAMTLYKMGEGPSYFFFKAYHLVHLELPMTLQSILVDREPLGKVTEPHVAEVVAIAKKPLAMGDELDGIGGFAAYGHIDTAAGADGFLPIGLLDYATLKKPVDIDAAIPLDSVSLDLSVGAVQLWLAQQQQWDRNPAFVESVATALN